MKTSSRMTPLQEEAAYNTGSAHDRGGGGGGGGGGGVILVNWSPAHWEERLSQVLSLYYHSAQDSEGHKGVPLHLPATKG